MVSHWGAGGQPDGHASRLVTLGVFPVLLGLLWLLFRFLPAIDPRVEAYDDFRGACEAFVALFFGFVLSVEVAVVAWNLGYEYDLALLLVPAVTALYAGIGLLLREAGQNWFVGIRTPWPLSDEAAWRATHRRAARGFLLAAVLALVGLAFPEYALAFVVGPVLFVSIDAVVYPFWPPGARTAIHKFRLT